MNLKREAWERHHAEFECPHPSTQIRRRQIRGGSFQFVRQCLACGKPTGNPIKRAEAELESRAPIEDWDIDLEHGWESRRLASANAASKAGEAEFWSEYGDYLNSSAWRAKRQKVLERDRFMCQGCLENRTTQVHHLSYEHVGRELLFELTSLCDECHEVAHDDKND